MKNILWLSPFTPYDKIPHGGGQNHNYYVKYIKKNTDNMIELISVCDIRELKDVDLEKYGINNITKIYNNHNIKIIFEIIKGKFFIKRDGGLLNNAKYQLIKNAIKEYCEKQITPDIIIMQWTEMICLVSYLKKYFPNAIYIGIEEDVAFLGYERKYKESKGLHRMYKKKKYEYLKRAELTSLSKCDFVVSLNSKDRELLINNGIKDDKIFMACSYHGFYYDCQYRPEINTILFYGAMSRVENYKSVIWFIENVFPKLDEKIKLFVVGANPSKKLKEYETERIHFTGYVEDIRFYLENSLCLVSPLLLGAGIKIKILEALSAGLPVITNSIGAEGIELTDGVNYIYASEVQDYVEGIKKLQNDVQFRNSISRNGKVHVREKFDVDNSLNELINIIDNI